MRKQIINILVLFVLNSATPYGATPSGLVVTAKEGTPLEAATISL